MKRTISVLLIIIMILSLFTACGSGEKPTDSAGIKANVINDAFLVNTAKELTDQMCTFAADQTAVYIFSSAAELVSEAALVGDIPSAPSRVFIATIDSDILESFISLYGGSDEDIPGDVLELIRSRMHPSVTLTSMLFSTYGTTSLALSSILTTSNSYYAPSVTDTEYVVFIICEDSAYSSATSFHKSGDGIIQASAKPIPTEMYYNLTDTLSELGIDLREHKSK